MQTLEGLPTELLLLSAIRQEEKTEKVMGLLAMLDSGLEVALPNVGGPVDHLRVRETGGFAKGLNLILVRKLMRSVLNHPIRENIGLFLGIFDGNGLACIATGLLFALGWFLPSFLGGGSDIIVVSVVAIGGIGSLNNREAPIKLSNERINRFIDEGIGVREQTPGQD